MDAKQPTTTVRLQALDGRWETVGVDRLSGIYAEDVSLTANEWGSDTCRFTLKRTPGSVYPDLTAFTPAEVEVDGEVVWSGRVWETPQRDGSDASISIEGQGWQYHLDDDVYSFCYVHTRLSDYVDQRSLLTADLTNFPTSAAVNHEGTAIFLGFPRGAVVANGGGVGVTLDLGPINRIKRAVVEWVPVDQNIFRFYMTAHDTENVWPNTQGSHFVGPINMSGMTRTPRTDAGTVATTRRYFTIWMQNESGASFTVNNDDYWIRIRRAQVFGDTAWESGNESILAASDVVKDARNRATILLSSSNERITSTVETVKGGLGFAIPEFNVSELQTPREAISAVNAYHSFRTRVDVDKLIRFDSLPGSPKYVVGEWDGIEFEDAAANAGEPIYSRVIGTASGPDGKPLQVITTAASRTSRSLEVPSSPTINNPSFATDATGWNVSGGSLARDTAVFDTSPASGLWTGQSASSHYIEAVTAGTFQRGFTYRLDFRVRLSSTSKSFEVRFGDIAASDFASSTSYIHTANAWQTVSVAWTPSADRTTGRLRIFSPFGSSGGSAYVDSLALYQAKPTLVDRRGFIRTKILPISIPQTSESLTRLTEIYMDQHMTAPMRGTLKITGYGGARTYLGHSTVSPAHLLTETQELIHFSHRVNPDTGAWGREGRIASVSWDATTNSASVAIDSDRNRFETLLARLAVVIGQRIR